MVINGVETDTVIFDFDGVIAETDSGRLAVLRELLSKRGLFLADDIPSEDFAGLNTRIFLKRIFSDMSIDEVEEIVRERQQIFANNLEKYCRPFDGVVDFISFLKQKGCKLILVTTNDLQIAKMLLGYLDVASMFSEVFGREQVQESDEIPKNYRFVMERLRINPIHTLVVEDSVVGVSAAKTAGLTCAVFGEKPLEAVIAMADFQIRSYPEFMKTLS